MVIRKFTFLLFSPSFLKIAFTQLRSCVWIWCHDVTMFMAKEIDSSGCWDQLCSEKQCESHWSMQKDLKYKIEEWLLIIAFRRMNNSRKERVVILKKITKKCLLHDRRSVWASICSIIISFLSLSLDKQREYLLMCIIII